MGKREKELNKVTDIKCHDNLNKVTNLKCHDDLNKVTDINVMTIFSHHSHL